MTSASLFDTFDSSAAFGTGDTLSQSLWENIYDEEDGGGDGERGSNEYFNNKDCVIFLIDAQSTMFEPNERDEVPFHNAVKCAIATMTDKIISSDTDLLGVCFYGTTQKQNLNEFDHLYVLQELDVPDAQRILELESLLKTETSPYGSCKEEFPFCDALWTCSTMFSNCTTKVGHRRIFLFTNDDNPNAHDQNVRDQSLQRAKDLSELGIDIELFNMNRKGHTFDPTLFYQHIISTDGEEYVGMSHLDASAKFEELRARVRRKEFKKRALGRIPFTLRSGLLMSVQLYNLMHEAKKNSHILLDSSTNQRVKIVTKYVCQATGGLLMSNQMEYYYPYGGEKIQFTSEELKSIKCSLGKGIQLMGFKPYSALKDYHFYRGSSFLYPDDSTVKGSSTLFAALLDRMLHKQRFALARFSPRDNAQPVFVALVPQEEEFDEDGTQSIPPGLHVIYLPFADDIRALDLPKTVSASADQVEKAKQVVKKLRIRFDSRSFENPMLQKHYATLQALALDREQIEAVPDYVLPDSEGMKQFAPLVQELRDVIYGPESEDTKDVKLLQKSMGKKRVRQPTEDGEDDKKKIQKLSTDEDYLDESLVNKLRIPDLKAYLKSRGVKIASSDRKADLVKKVVATAQEEAASSTVQAKAEPSEAE